MQRSLSVLDHVSGYIQSINVRGLVAGNEEKKEKAVIANFRITASGLFLSRFPYAGITRTGSRGRSAHSVNMSKSEFGNSQPISSPSTWFIGNPN